MRALRLWVAAGLLPVAAACGGSDAESGSSADTAAAMPDTASVGATAGAMGDSAAAGMAGMDSMSHSAAGGGAVPLAAVGGSGVTGEAMLTAQGNQTQVMVRLAGAKGAGTHQGHIHTGTCEQPGSVVAPLEPVTTDASGAGSSTKTVDVPASAAMNGQHIIAYHEAGGSPGAPVVCGAIPAHSM